MKTQTNTLLHAIWTGDVIPVHPGAKHALIDILETIFKIQTVVIEVPEGPLCGRVLQETTELMPDLPVGDVLEEELNISVPIGAVIVCLSRKALEAARGLKDGTRALGTVCAQIIVDAVQLAVSPIEDERQEMRQLAQMLMSVARHLAATTGSIDVAAFKAALARELSQLLEGPAGVKQVDAALAARFVPDAEAAPAPAAVLGSLVWNGAGMAMPAVCTATNPNSLLAFPEPGLAGRFAKTPNLTRKV